MTTFASSSWVSHLSRQKLQSVADDSSDTLRRCVLIHNVMRSTASSQSTASHSAPSYTAAPQIEPQPEPQPQFVFPSMDYSQEHQWLDSLLDDLVSDGDVQVSVVPVDDKQESSEYYQQSSVASSSYTLQRPASPPSYESIDSLFQDDDEEPSSPPPLEDHGESDDEDNDDSDSEASTPSSSTELLAAVQPNDVPPDYFNNLPFSRLRPPHFDLFY